MQIENHKEEVPFSYYEELYKKINPDEVAGRLSYVTFEDGHFTVKLLGRTYRLGWPEYSIEVEDGGKLPPLPTQTFLLRILLEGKDVKAGGEWKTFREMPWGEMYITPYTGRVLTRAAFTFGTRLAKFKAAAEKLGGIPVPHGDAGYQFDVVGPYQMRILVWEGDDEFPPNAQVLYTDNFATGFSAEDRVVSGDILIGHIKNAM